MARGTRLYQTPGSPLIRGHSKGERDSRREWLLGLAGALSVTFGLIVVYGLDPESSFVWSDLLDALRTTGFGHAPGALIGSGVGIWLAKGFGWRRQWLSAFLVGLLLGLISAWLVGLFVPSLLG